MNNLVIYHANCADGFCAAWLMNRHFKYLNEPCEFYAASYNQDPPDVKGKNVYILDFSYPRQTLLDMSSRVESLIVLDHHKTAEADLKGLGFCHFDMSKSGARMTLEMLKGDMVNNWLVNYTEDRDLWLWKLPESKAINAAIRSYTMSFEEWDALHQKAPFVFIPEGLAILRAEKQIVDAAVRNARDYTFDGYRGRGVNATTLISETGGELAKGYDFGLCWFEKPNGDRVFSLRSIGDRCDVSAICKKRGGGGHKNAAGFCMPVSNADVIAMRIQK